jgi:hypothetical protein
MSPPPSLAVAPLRRLVAALAPVLLLLVAGGARAGDPREGEQIWAMALAQGGFGFVHPKLARVRGWLELQGRWRSFGESYETGFLPRVGIGYALTDQMTLMTGFAVIENDPAQKKPFTELRPWQQLSWNLPVRGFGLQSRTRLEQRIHQENLGWRLRELVKATVPLPGTDRVFLAAYDELFFDLDDTPWGQRRGFRQNRFFAGPGLRLDREKHVVLEVGYLNQWIDRRREDRDNHVLSLNLVLTY